MRFSYPILLLAAAGIAAAWSKEDHEIFRLKDEIESTEGPINFYEFINAPSTYATQEELNTAYRKTSRVIHPDKFRPQKKSSKTSKSKDSKESKPFPPKSTYYPKTRKEADERFARLGLVANILRGPERDRYDHFLRNGFPRWRGTGYYYSRFRPGLFSVLFGLWVTFAGGVHFVILSMNYKQQRKFMEGYINDARVAAWGSSVGAALNIDSVTDSSATGAQQVQGNRKQRRAAKKEGNSGTSTPVIEKPQHVAKRKVTSENGKTFMVTSLGDVFLLEEDEDGVTQEYLLDLEEIPKATWGRTAMVSAPKALWDFIAAKVGLGGKSAEDVLGDVDLDISIDGPEETLEKRVKKKGKGPGRK